MLFSVIIPVYNAQQTLDQCVRSVLNQSFTDFELVLVDDGSRDESPRMCDEYAVSDRRVVVVHQENKGLACARNAGLSKARGEYIVHLDCDDYLVDGGLEKIVTRVRQQPTAQILVWNILQLQGEMFESEANTFPDTSACCLTGVRAFNFLFCSNQGSLWQTFRYVVKRSYIIDKQLFYRPGVLHEDIDFNPYVVLCAERVHFCAEAYYIYRKGRDGSITSHVTTARCKDMIFLVQRWFEFLSTVKLAPAIVDGFRATLSRLLWDYVPEVLRFPGTEKDELLDLLVENKAVLMWVRIPLLSAFVKRGLLVCLGLKATAMALGMLRAIRRR